MGTIEYRDDNYDKWAHYYAWKYHNAAETDLTARQLREKSKLRQWLNWQSGLRRKPRIPGIDDTSDGSYRQ